MVDACQHSTVVLVYMLTLSIVALYISYLHAITLWQHLRQVGAPYAVYSNPFTSAIDISFNVTQRCQSPWIHLLGVQCMSISHLTVTPMYGVHNRAWMSSSLSTGKGPPPLTS